MVPRCSEDGSALSFPFPLFLVTPFHIFPLLTSFFLAHTHLLVCVRARASMHVLVHVCGESVYACVNTQGWYPLLSTLVTEMGSLADPRENRSCLV